MIRSATPFPLVSLFFMFIGFVLSNIGHVRPHRTILAFVSGIFFILSGTRTFLFSSVLSLVLPLTLHVPSSLRSGSGGRPGVVHLQYKWWDAEQDKEQWSLFRLQVWLVLRLRRPVLPADWGEPDENDFNLNVCPNDHTWLLHSSGQREKLLYHLTWYLFFYTLQSAGVMSVYLFMKRYTAEELYQPRHPTFYRPRLSNCSDHSGQFLHPEAWSRGRSPSDISSEASLQMSASYPTLLKCPDYDQMSSSPCWRVVCHHGTWSIEKRVKYVLEHRKWAPGISLTELVFAKVYMNVCRDTVDWSYQYFICIYVVSLHFALCCLISCCFVLCVVVLSEAIMRMNNTHDGGWWLMMFLLIANEKSRLLSEVCSAKIRLLIKVQLSSIRLQPVQ